MKSSILKCLMNLSLSICLFITCIMCLCLIVYVYTREISKIWECCNNNSAYQILQAKILEFLIVL